MFPNETLLMREQTRSYIAQITAHFEHQFATIIDSHLQSIQQQVNLTNIDILKFQLSALQKLPHIAPHTSITDLPEDQYRAITVLTNMMGSRNNHGHIIF